MNGKEDMNFKSEQESREERVLALLLDELDADEAKSIEALLAEDADLQVYRAGLDRTLDLISESARAKADIELEDFKLDPDRRRILEKLWTDKDSDSETEESGEAIRFPHGNESEDKSRSKLSRFLPMAASPCRARPAPAISTAITRGFRTRPRSMSATGWRGSSG